MEMGYCSIVELGKAIKTWKELSLRLKEKQEGGCGDGDEAC
jgi:hypothetical protein